MDCELCLQQWDVLNTVMNNDTESRHFCGDCVKCKRPDLQAVQTLIEDGRRVAVDFPQVCVALSQCT